MKLRWFELGRVDKGVSVIGLTVGGVGIILFEAFWAAHGSFSSQNSLGYDIAALTFIVLFSIPFLVPLLSALGLLLLQLREEQRGILGFVSLITSIFAVLPIYYVLFAVYCSATHSNCS